MTYFEKNREHYTKEMIEARDFLLVQMKRTYFSYSDTCEKYLDTVDCCWQNLANYYSEMKVSDCFMIVNDLWMDQLAHDEPSRVKTFSIPGFEEVENFLDKMMEVVKHE